MRVAYVTPVIPHPRAGFYRSIERIVQAEIAGATARGHTVEVFTTYWNGGLERDAFLGCPVTRLPDSSLRWGRLGRVADIDYLSFGRAAMRAIGERRSAFDLIHSQCRLPGITQAQKRNGLPVVIHFHHRDRVARALDLARMPFENAANGRAFRAAKLVTASSAAGAKDLTSAWGVDPTRTRVLYPGLLAPLVEDRPARPGFHVLFVGTLIPRKRVATLLEALALLQPDVRATIVGEGPEEEALRALASKRGVTDRVRFLRGTGSEAELDALYRAADALVLPSAAEGFGMVLAEAMAHGTPVVASDIPACRETVGDAGLLFPLDDARALAERLEGLRCDPARAQALGEAGRRRALERFTWEAHTEALLAIWKEAIG